jgi:antitoxin ParD1/3/4
MLGCGLLNLSSLGEGQTIMTTVTISIPESLKKFVHRQMATKGYGNVSEYFRSLLREAQEQEQDARLEVLLREGLAGGEDVPLTREFWTDLKAEAVQIAQRHKVRKKT